MITPFGLRHIWQVHNLEACCAFLDPAYQVTDVPVRPLRSALSGYFLERSGAFTYVLRADDAGARWRGFVQARRAPASSAWKVVCLAPDLDSSADAPTIWYRLLLHLCIAAGERHVQRLHACVQQESVAEEVVRQASFNLYCHDTVWTLARLDQWRGSVSERVRPARPEDAWNIQQLWLRAMPRQVRQAEGIGENGNGRLVLEQARLEQRVAFVLTGADACLLGYAAVWPAGAGSWLRILLDPSAREGVDELVSGVVSALGDAAPGPVYCAVRDYQGGVAGVLQEGGFESAFRRSLLVKHTTVQVHEARRKLVPALEKQAGVAPTVSRCES